MRRSILPVIAVLFAALMILPPLILPLSLARAASDNDKSEKGVVVKPEAQEPTAPKVKTTAKSSWQQLTSGEYITLPETDRETYVTGLSDAYNWSFMGGFRQMSWFVGCTDRKSGTELAGLFDKWLTEHPDSWEDPAAKSFAFAIFSTCDSAAGSK